MIRALIVDDERLARNRLVRLLRRREDVEVAGVAVNGDQALEMIASTRPELVFLDVKMPGVSGFDVIAAAGERMPHVVFTTAFDEYALRAFEVHALDYLLKPFDEERLFASVDRAAALIRSARVPRLETIVVRTPGRVVFLSLQEVEWIEAAGNYVYVHAGKEKHLLRASLKQMSGRLDAHRFTRVHRSAIVNVTRIRELRPRAHGDAEVILRSGAQLVASRTYAARLRKRMSARP
ncbi:MAG TPA: LytTR family transcriptional regulator DNA-binding domain-containing protein [Thermoanaerobaculia bacterium]|nr:LytTR family transcriptional regulator DNA-binding domain-containing protein [Thermoanaerobaculia bacterium]